MKSDEKKLTYQTREIPAQFEARSAEDGTPIIEGYFAVFNSVYDMGNGMSESIAPGAFEKTISGDIRALINHDTTLVMGRTTAGTLELREDQHGLWGRIYINPKDTDAMNAYARVERGDVTQCSIGFDILSEETDFRDDGTIHWTIKEVELFEVSVCTFPAYESTAISARQHDFEEIKKRAAQEWRERMHHKLKGENDNGTESTDAEKEDH